MVSILGFVFGDYIFIVRDVVGCFIFLLVIILQVQEFIFFIVMLFFFCSSDDGIIMVMMEEGFFLYIIILNDGLEIIINNNFYIFEGFFVGLYIVKVEYGFVCEAEVLIELNMFGFECNEGWLVFDLVCLGDLVYLYFDGSGIVNEIYQVWQVNVGFLLVLVLGNGAVFIEV